MKKPTPPNPNPIACTFPSSVTPRGDGSYIVTPGKPVIAATLTPKELAIRFGKSRRTIYRWISEGLIPEQFVHHAGLREVCISVEAVTHLRTKFRERHE
jgi:excisionase family DNA binding protein